VLFRSTDTILSVLLPHLEDEGWLEVVLLSAVLGGRRAYSLMQSLVERTKNGPKTYVGQEGERVAPVTLLRDCIADEVQVSPELLREAVRWISRRDDGAPRGERILSSKYAPIFIEVCMQEIQSTDEDLLGIGSTIGDFALSQIGWPQRELAEVAGDIRGLLGTNDPLNITRALLAAMTLGWTFCPPSFANPERSELGQSVKSVLVDLLEKAAAFVGMQPKYLTFAAAWALVWLAKATRAQLGIGTYANLFSAWQAWQLPEIRFVSAWALLSLPLMKRAPSQWNVSPEMIAFIESKVAPEPSLEFPETSWREAERSAALTMAYYFGKPWTDAELVQLIRVPGNGYESQSPLPEIVREILGDSATDTQEKEEQQAQF
jgi:hypothetical protein